MSQKIVLITGANQGLGFEVVKKLAAEQPNYLIILCARDLKKGQKAASEVSNLAKGTTIDTLELDVTSDASIESARQQLEQRYGHIDVLFNNAGVGSSQAKNVREQMHQIFDVNVAGVVAVTDSFIPLLKKAKHPRLVIMTSDLGSITNTLDTNHYAHFYQETAYKPSKAAVNMVGAVYSVKYGKEGLRVNLVNPGFRATNLNDHSEHAGKKEDGAIEPCRVIALGDEGDSITFTEAEGSIGW